MNLSRIPKTLLWIIGLLVIVVVAPSALFAIRYIATNNLACETCHPNLYAMWQESKAHPKEKSNCRECHTKKAYQMKPIYLSDPETINVHCESCHDDLFEKVQVEKVKIIKISHKRHLNENLTCFDCHRNVAHDKVDPATNRPRKQICLNCHVREIEGSPEDAACMMCHYIILDQRASLSSGS